MEPYTNAETAQDEYVTRHAGKPTQRPRRHPTVWGTGQAGPISAFNLEEYERNGFLTLDQLLTSDEVLLCREELRRMNLDTHLRNSSRVVLEPDSNEIRSVFEVHRISEVLSSIIYSSKVTDHARQVLGSEVYIHQSRINFKPGFGGAEFHWHSDFETWHAEDGMPAPRALSMSIALTDNIPGNGPLMIIPGSHKTFVSCPGETPSDYHESSLRDKRPAVGSADHACVTELAGKHGIQQIEGKAGSAVLFDCNCLHASGSNMSPYPRSNVFVVFNSVENKLVEPFYAPKPRPEYVASREFTPATTSPR
ncbi:ectoine hydroxylase [Amycolatopsis anabasis]|uniref:ectoine hydroxylase n=1 Tax=Amycolatopsis anabasis TaxID=1840409 RepID=UPI00131DE335